MSQPFTFPPPPPPPPPPPRPNPAQSSYTNTQPGSRGGHTNSFSGRGSGFGGRGSSRGRGQRPPSGHHGRGGYGYHPTPNNNRNLSDGGAVQASSVNQSHFGAVRGQKRNYGAAFNNHTYQARTPAAPHAVPSFGHDLENLVLQKNKPQGEASEVKASNALGLTPAVLDDSDPEDEIDEEAKHADSHADNALQFEYRGSTSTLSTPEEIAAWIAERKKKWPTEAKRDAAKEEADEKRKKWLEQKAIRAENANKAAQQRQEERQKQRAEREKAQLRQKMLREQINKAKAPTGPNQQDLSPAQNKTERLRRKAAKIAAQLEKAEKELEGSAVVATDENATQSGNKFETQADDDLEQMLKRADEAAQKHAQDLDLSDVETSSESEDDARDPKVDREDTSTSGSSSEDESDSDAPPEASSSRQPVSALTTDDLRKDSRKQQQAQRFCPNLAKSGRCRFGKKCRYSHARDGNRKGASNTERRKGLYEIMVEKEQEEQRKRAVQMIIAMGERGVFDDTVNS